MMWRVRNGAFDDGAAVAELCEEGSGALAAWLPGCAVCTARRERYRNSAMVRTL